MPHADLCGKQPTPDDGPGGTHGVPDDRPERHDRYALPSKIEKGKNEMGDEPAILFRRNSGRSRPRWLTLAPASAIVAI